MSNPFYDHQEWPNWEPLSLGSVKWCLIAAQFSVQTVREQNVVEYSLRKPNKTNEPLIPDPPPNQNPNYQQVPLNSRNGRRAQEYAYTKKETAILEMQEAFIEAQLRMERELLPSHLLIPEIKVTHVPEWRPLPWPKAFQAQPEGKQVSAEPNKTSTISRPASFLIFAQPHQVPMFCSQSGSGLVCMRAFTIHQHSTKPWLEPLDAGILTLIQPLIHIHGLLPLTGPPRFPLQEPGPVAKSMNGIFEASKQRDPRGVLWTLVDWTFQHPVETGA